MSENFDSSNKENWSILKAKEIAKFLGYYQTQRFKYELNNFIFKYIINATTFNLLGACAEGHFLNIKPPLRRIKNHIPDPYKKIRY